MNTWDDRTQDQYHRRLVDQGGYEREVLRQQMRSDRRLILQTVIFTLLVLVFIAAVYRLAGGPPPSEPEVTLDPISARAPGALDRVWCLDAGDQVRYTCASMPNCECSGVGS